MTLSFLGKKDSNTVSITMEHGVIKLLVCHGLEIVDYRVLLPNPRFFREGQVSNPARVGVLIRNALAELDGDFYHAIGAVPGFQNRLGLMHFPRASGFHAETIIPQEATRIMKVSPETYHDVSRLIMAMMGHTEVKTSARYIRLATEGLERIMRRDR